MHNEKSSKKLESLLTPLEYLALHKEATIEEIAKQTGKNYSTILRATSELCAKRLAAYRLERTAPRGKDLRIYAISFYGLVFYLSRSQSIDVFSPKISEVAKAHEDMLLIFKKWNKFVQANCEQELLSKFAQALHTEYYYHSEHYATIMMPKIKFVSSEEEKLRREAFDDLVLGFFYLDHPVEHVKESIGKKEWNQLEKLWQVVEEDYDLRKRRDTFLSYLVIQHTEGLKAISEWRKYFQEKTA